MQRKTVVAKEEAVVEDGDAEGCCIVCRPSMDIRAEQVIAEEDGI